MKPPVVCQPLSNFGIFTFVVSHTVKFGKGTKPDFWTFIILLDQFSNGVSKLENMVQR